MNLMMFRRHFDYMFQMDRQLWSLIEQLSMEQFDAPNDYSLGSVHEQVVHMMSVQAVWLTRLQGQQARVQTAANYPERSLIRAQWDATERRWRDYLASLSETDLLNTIESRPSDGRVHQEPVWEVMLHVVNHDTDHRAQVLQAMHSVGGKTMPQDWIYYARRTR